MDSPQKWRWSICEWCVREENAVLCVYVQYVCIYLSIPIYVYLMVYL